MSLSDASVHLSFSQSNPPPLSSSSLFEAVKKVRQSYSVWWIIWKTQCARSLLSRCSFSGGWASESRSYLFSFRSTLHSSALRPLSVCVLTTVRSFSCGSLCCFTVEKPLTQRCRGQRGPCTSNIYGFRSGGHRDTSSILFPCMITTISIQFEQMLLNN